jgi:hypothetical protein
LSGTQISTLNSAGINDPEGLENITTLNNITFYQHFLVPDKAFCEFIS